MSFVGKDKRENQIINYIIIWPVDNKIIDGSISIVFGSKNHLLFLIDSDRRFEYATGLRRFNVQFLILFINICNLFIFNYIHLTII